MERCELLRLSAWRDVLQTVLFNRWFLLFLWGLNFGGSVYGYYWYRHQLAATPWYLWPFTPECPNQTLLMSIVIILLLLGRRSELLEGLTYLGLIKYGSWTVYVLLGYWLSGGEVDLESVQLVLSHMGMVVEGLLFLQFYRIRAETALLAAGWFAFNDYLDYWVGIHPWLPDPGQLPAARAFALATTAVIGVWLAVVVWQNRRRGNAIKALKPEEGGR